MKQSSNQWTPATMREYIRAQNNYRYDGGNPIQHSAESLASFAGIEGEQLAKFIKVYNKMYEAAE